MANHLSMAKVSGILSLHHEGWSQRRIAETLGIDRKTVGQHLAAEAAKRAKAPTGKAPTGSDDSKRAKAPTGSDGLSEAESAELEGVNASPLGAADEPEKEKEKIPGEREENAVPTAVVTRSACRVWQAVIEEKL